MVDIYQYHFVLNSNILIFNVNTINKDKIFKNTIALYFRQILSIIISIYSVRVILHELGEINYGIYNVVGGVVSLFTFISHSLASSTQRYLSVSIPSGIEKVRETFSDSFWMYIVLMSIVFVLVEIAGVYILNNVMQIPVERLEAAHWVLQCTIISFLMTLLASPFFALIITYEKMTLFAIVSIVESVLKLFAALLIPFFHTDCLIIYSLLILLVTICTQGYYVMYCKRHYKVEINVNPVNEFKMTKSVRSMIVFAFWNLFKTLASVLKGQGINIILNVFFSPVVNAARGIAYQIENAVTNFTNSVYLAIRPQIFQSYKRNELNGMFSLVYMSSKVAFFLLLLISSIIIFRTDFILVKWLGNAPKYTDIFIRLVLVNCIIDAFSTPVLNSIYATAKIGRVQFFTSLVIFANLPLSYLLLWIGALPYVVYYISIGLSLIVLVLIIYFAHKTVNMSIGIYATKVLLPVLITTILSQVPIYWANLYIEQTWIGMFVFCLIATVWTLLIIYLCGLSRDEKAKIITIINNKIKKE